MRKLTQEEIIKRFIEVHGNKYDYSKVEYRGMQKHVIIICPKHGEFMMTPHNHISGQGCPECVGRNMNTEKAIKRAIEIHGNYYSFDEFKYIKSNVKSIVICPKHGRFEITPNDLFQGGGCPKCRIDKMKEKNTIKADEFKKRGYEKFGGRFDYSDLIYNGYQKETDFNCPIHGKIRMKPKDHLKYKYGCPKCTGRSLSTYDWIKRFFEVHGNLYSYDEFVFLGSKIKSIVICPKHGRFEITPNAHYYGEGCPECAKERVQQFNSMGKEKFLEKAYEIYHGEYRYGDNMVYVNAHTPINAYCDKHGWFETTPNNHLKGKGCPKCAREITAAKLSLGNEGFKERIHSIYGKEFLLDKVNYINNRTPIEIGCKKHGYFEVIPEVLFRGNGCPMCNKLRSESEVMDLLAKKGIKFEHEKTFDWLLYKGKQRLDFYLSDYNIAIEYQGIQHFIPVDYANKGKEWAMEQLNENKKRDKNKKELCEKHGIKVYYINYNEDKEIKINTILSELKNS